MPKFSTNGKCPTGYTLHAHEDELCNCGADRRAKTVKAKAPVKADKDDYQEWADGQW